MMDDFIDDFIKDFLNEKKRIKSQTLTDRDIDVMDYDDKVYVTMSPKAIVNNVSRLEVENEAKEVPTLYLTITYKNSIRNYRVRLPAKCINPKTYTNDNTNVSINNNVIDIELEKRGVDNENR